jgi:vacuolar-type H+-ATPase subunit H
MKEIIEKILKEEETAKKRIEESYRQAEQLIAQAKKESETVLNAARRDVQELVRNRHQEAEESFLKEKKAILAKAREDAVSLRMKQEQDVSRYAQDIFTRILGLSLERQ